MSAPVLAGSVIADRYRVERVLGEGGMGVVVLATHLVLQQRVAIKFLRREAMVDDDVVNRFLREARAAAKVQSDRVVRVHDVTTLSDGTPYIVMEYFEGSDLATILARGPLPVDEAVRYVFQTCEALVETHAAGIIHGDLKPENIYIARSADGVGRVKLLDFGISKIVLEDKTTGLPNVAGTPCYMAPEQLEHGSFDLRADLWSLGTVLYELLAGQPPFLADTPEETCKLVVRSPVPPITRRDIPAALQEVVRRCLVKDPARRVASATELALALEPHVPHRASASNVERVRSRSDFGTTPGLGLESAAGLPSTRTSRIVGVIVGTTVAAIIVGALVFAGVLRRGGASAVAVAPKSVTTAAATSAPDVHPVSSAPAAGLPAAPDAPPVVSDGTAAVPVKSSPSPRAGRRAPRAPTAVDKKASPPEEAPSSEADRFGTRK